MSSGESEFTDLDELPDEDEYVPTVSAAAASSSAAGKKRSRGAAGAEFRIQGPLKPYRNVTYTTSSLSDMIESKQIDLEPEYQRDVVWVDHKQVGLIDSIFRNYYIPPIIFAVTSDDDGTVLRTCIDGKQRLSSIRAFLSGKIYHRDVYTGKKWWYTPVPRGKQGARLPDKFRALFEKKQVSCVEYDDLHGDEEREIFKRVQLGVALEPAERLQVVQSPTASAVRAALTTFVSPPPGSASAYARVPWDTKRGNDFKNTAHALYAIVHGGGRDGIGTLAKLDRWLNAPTPVPPAAAAAFDRALRALRAIERDATLRAAAFETCGAKFAPLEFVGALVLLARHAERRSLRGLAEGIARMRAHVRARHKDVFARTAIVRDVLDFIASLAGDGSGGAMGEIEASERAWVHGAAHGGATVATKGADPKKRGRPRKRSASDEEDPEETVEDEPAPPPKKKGKGKAKQTDVRGDDDYDDGDVYAPGPAKKKTTAAKKKQAPLPPPPELSEEDETDDKEVAPPPPPSKRRKAARAAPPESDDDQPLATSRRPPARSPSVMEISPPPGARSRTQAHTQPPLPPSVDRPAFQFPHSLFGRSTGLQPARFSSPSRTSTPVAPPWEAPAPVPATVLPPPPPPTIFVKTEPEPGVLPTPSPSNATPAPAPSAFAAFLNKGRAQPAPVSAPPALQHAPPPVPQPAWSQPTSISAAAYRYVLPPAASQPPEAQSYVAQIPTDGARYEPPPYERQSEQSSSRLDADMEDVKPDLAALERERIAARDLYYAARDAVRFPHRRERERDRDRGRSRDRSRSRDRDYGRDRGRVYSRGHERDYDYRRPPSQTQSRSRDGEWLYRSPERDRDYERRRDHRSAWR